MTNVKNTFLFAVLSLTLLHPSVSLAQSLDITPQGYQLLAPLGANNEVREVTTGGFAGYAQLIISMIIGLSAVLAVLMIMFGGFMYMTGEAIHTKEAGRETMLNAVYGLLLLLSCWLILNTINPQLLNLDLNPNQSTNTGTPTSGNCTPGPNGTFICPVNP